MRILWSFLRRLGRRGRCFTVLLAIVMLLLIRGMFYGTSTDLVCDYGAAHRSKLIEMANSTITILNNLNIQYFACYGTMWALIRNSRLTFPWARDLQFCVRNEDLMKYDELFVAKQWHRQRMRIVYNSRNGVYDIAPHGSSPFNERTGLVHLIVFETQANAEDMGKASIDEKMMRRVGWAHRMLPPGSAGLHEFPERLIGGRSLSRTHTQEGLHVTVASEGIELQKYHYVDDWWRERRPNC